MVSKKISLFFLGKGLVGLGPKAIISLLSALRNNQFLTESVIFYSVGQKPLNLIFFQSPYHAKRLKRRKKHENGQKSIQTSFWVPTATKSWSVYTNNPLTWIAISTMSVTLKLNHVFKLKKKNFFFHFFPQLQTKE